MRNIGVDGDKHTKVGERGEWGKWVLKREKDRDVEGDRYKHTRIIFAGREGQESDGCIRERRTKRDRNI